MDGNVFGNRGEVIAWLCARIVPTGLGSNRLEEEREVLCFWQAKEILDTGVTARVYPRRTGTTYDRVQQWVSALLPAEILIRCSV